MSSSQPTYVAIVDDDETICRSLGRLLRAAGLQPITYSSAEAFLTDAKHPQFDCLVLDFELGGMSGLELSRQLALGGSTVPVIFITACDESEARPEIGAAGCVAYFGKTDSGAAVLDAIRRATARTADQLSPTNP